MLSNLINPYFWVISIRNLLYDLKVLPSKRLSIPVISIGNLSAGELGKQALCAILLKISQRSSMWGFS